MDIFIPTRNDTVAVDNTSLRVCQPNSGRSVFVLRNSSAGGQIITIAQGNVAVVAEKGIVLTPGQAYSETNGEGFQAWKGEIQAIASAAGGVLSVFER